MPSHCHRCGAQVHGLPEHQPHLCSDIAMRLKRREAQVQAILPILRELNNRHDSQAVEDEHEAAEAIVAKLAGMGVTDDV